jgi:DnaJ-domain-containing protein 1
MSRNTAQYWIARFGLGVALLVLAGVGVLGPMLGRARPAAVLLGFWGFYLAFTSITPLIRFATLESRMRTAWSDAATAAFARASLPRRIYYLLASIAEVDGPMSPAEREAVRHFLLDRFVDPVQTDELRSWEAQPLPVTDRIGLAARIATGIDQGELDSLFCWCCLVAFADGKYAEHEHLALQDVAKGLGIAAARARMLFHLARAQYLRGHKHGESTRAGGALDARAHALQTLGLPAEATPDQVRRRHRELVRRFHPDAQPHLGPVALKEATERFTEIQRAYETLTT